MVAAQVVPGISPLSPNERLKVTFPSWFWGSVTLAAILHFLLISLWPHMSVADWGVDSREFTAIEIPPQVVIPPPPQDIPRPVVPVISPDVNFDPELTIPETRISDHPVERLPAPPTGTGLLSDHPVYAPREIEPGLSAGQRTALQRYLERNYPPALRDAGIAGRVDLWVFVDETGKVQSTRVVESSGYPQLDALAQQAVGTVTFSPAMNRDQRVPVWVRFPIVYTVRN